MSNERLETTRSGATMEPRVVINVTGTAGSGKTLITTLILEMLAKLEATNVTLEFNEASEDKYHLENFAAPEHTEFAINKLKNTGISVRDNPMLYNHKANYDFSQNRNPKQITPAMNDFISQIRTEILNGLLKPTGPSSPLETGNWSTCCRLPFMYHHEHSVKALEESLSNDTMFLVAGILRYLSFSVDASNNVLEIKYSKEPS